MNEFYVGQEVSEEKKFEQSEVIAFSEISGDNNPLHLDEEFARNSRFGAPVVHGILVAGLISKIIGTQFPGEGSIYLEQNLRFLKPVYVGECVVVKVKITDIILDKKIFLLETNVYNKNEICVLCGSAKVLYENDNVLTEGTGEYIKC